MNAKYDELKYTNGIFDYYRKESRRMINIEKMDKAVTFFEQMEQEVGPVILINKFTVKLEEADQFIRAWAGDAAIMKQQPGYISTQLHRAIGGSCAFLNYAVWESVEDFRRAFQSPEFQATLSAYPPSAVISPHLFQILAVPECCIA